MIRKLNVLVLALLGSTLLVGSTSGALTDSLKTGTPDLKSAGPLAFGPDGVLFVGDPQGAAIFAFDTGDTKQSGTGPLKVQGVNEKVAALLGTEAQQIIINDLAVNPASGNAYLSVSRGKGPDAKPAIVKVDRASGKVAELPVANAKFAKTTLPNPSTKSRTESITDIAFHNGTLVVSGLSNEDWASTLRSIPFPFSDANKGTGVEVYHGAHGKFETHAPVRTFVHYDINGQAHLLAAYQCTPLVKIPVSDLKPGTKVKGTTIAELGSGNRPLDMIVYNKTGKDFVLISNTKRGIMKLPTEGVEKLAGITTPAKGGTPTGAKYETVGDWKGVMQLDRLDKDNALVLIDAAGSLNLETLPLP
jgi:hypothetical protein